MITPQYVALQRLKWFHGSDSTLQILLLEIVRSCDFMVPLLPEWYAPLASYGLVQDREGAIYRRPMWNDLRTRFHTVLDRLEEAYYPLLHLSRSLSLGRKVLNSSSHVGFS